MELKIPTPEQAYWGLRAMKAVALADGTLDASERQVMAAVQRVFGTHHQTEELEPITPEELAGALPDPQISRQLVNGLVVMSLIDREVSPREAELVERFAAALQVTAPEVTCRQARAVSSVPRPGPAFLAQGKGGRDVEAGRTAGARKVRGRHDRQV